MNIRLWKTSVPFVILGVACALSGCRHGSDADCAQVRLIDAVPDPAGVSAAVNNHLVWKHSDYADSSGYQKVNAGHYQIRLQAGDKAASQDVALDKGRHYTLVALAPPKEGLTARVFGDDSNAPMPDGKARLMVIDAAGASGAVDILVNNIVAVQNIGAGRRAAPLFLKAGDYQIKANAPDSVRTLAGPLPLHLNEGHAYTLVLMGGDASGYVMKTFADNGG